MKLIAWNLNHRTLEKPIPGEATQFLEAFRPDLIALNEFVDGPSRAAFKSDLERLGLNHQLISEQRGKQNRVFIASRSHIRQGDLLPPAQDDASVSNFLHVICDTRNLEIVGFRAPAYKTGPEKQAYWRDMAKVMATASDRPIVFFGDVNYDPFQGVSATAPTIKFDLSGSYSVPNPEGDWSFISLDETARTRIDHAMVTSRIRVEKTQYLQSFAGIKLAGGKDSGAVSDHAALALTVFPC